MVTRTKILWQTIAKSGKRLSLMWNGTCYGLFSESAHWEDSVFQLRCPDVVCESVCAIAENPLPVDWRLLTEEGIANIALPQAIFGFLPFWWIIGFWIFFWLWGLCKPIYFLLILLFLSVFVSLLLAAHIKSAFDWIKG